MECFKLGTSQRELFKGKAIDFLMEINKDMGINDLIDKYPDVIPVLMGYGLHCVGCTFASHDTLEQGANLHGIQGEELEMMLKDINTTIKTLCKENEK